MIPLDTRRQMVEREEGAMSICYQCELLGISRSSLYYTPTKASNKDLQIMEELDRLVHSSNIIELKGESLRKKR
jgi:predicted transcriptional regulator